MMNDEWVRGDAQGKNIKERTREDAKKKKEEQ